MRQCKPSKLAANLELLIVNKPGVRFLCRVSKDDTRFPRDINGNVKMAVLSENSDELSVSAS